MSSTAIGCPSIVMCFGGDALREHVAERRRFGVEQMLPYLEGEGLFQERAHIVVIVGDLISRILGVLDDWAQDVTHLAATWDSTAGIGLTPEVRAVLQRMIDELQPHTPPATGVR